MKFLFLTQQFYSDYMHCTEIEKKINRPYIMFKVTIDEIDYAVPLRSNINHKYVYWTDKENNCGLDFSKTVIITDSNYIDTSTNPYIRPNEFKTLKGKQHIIKKKLSKYIKDYKKALQHLEAKHNETLCNYSTLQYFHTELGIKDRQP
ncbi:type III toxin-antitoxin system TenpIN family toxin [Clostridium sp. ZS2-4]|uniref:type III toxin-antitoxin system TenpIN family toxin n=1 Tax=Clostridium sp. ZS2-4 TaxID=2987703 RepID=UPI00227AA2B0|nr:hypothetical protein [Clostridium sp. ZS2-4]MCY6354742.1 hypothetical protein [Clostridium sp. ZS2-4]